MKIPGIAYIIIGVFMSGLSGYVYKFVPKSDGTPNMSMVLFFFIGIIFIIVGLIKLFFKKIEDEKETEYNKAKQVLEKNAQHTKYAQNTPEHSAHKNRIEEQLNNAVQQQNQKTQHHTQDQATHHTQHTSGYAKTHPYHGVHQGDQQNNQQTGTHALNIVVCKRCGYKNVAVANYCHTCGNRLR